MKENTIQNLVESIGIADEVCRHAAALQDGIDKQAAAIKQRIPTCVDALVEHGRILPEHREKVANALQDPVKAIDLLTQLAAHRAPAEREALGRGVKTASANSSLKQSDRVLFAGLGLPLPTE